MTPEEKKKKKLSQGEIFKPPDTAEKQKRGVNFVKTGQHNKAVLPWLF